MSRHGNKGWRPAAPALTPKAAPAAACAVAGAPAVPERYGRFRHWLVGQRFAIGDVSIDFWPQGMVKSLPERIWDAAKAQGFEYLGPVAD